MSLLVPQQAGNEATKLAQLITECGSIMTLPNDLQSPFSKYLARSSINWLKRYTIGQIYKERAKVGGLREILELAYDIVSPSYASTLTDAEVIATISDVFHDDRMRLNGSVTLQICHHQLLKAVLVHCGIAEDQRTEVCKIFQTRRQSKETTQSRLLQLGVPWQSADVLVELLALKGSFSKVMTSLTNISIEAAAMAKLAFDEMRAIVEHAQFMGLRRKTTAVVMKLSAQNYSTYSGIVFRFVCPSKLNKYTLPHYWFYLLTTINLFVFFFLVRDKAEILASGGRYDALVSQHRNRFNQNQNVTGSLDDYPSVVGASIHMDAVMSLMKELVPLVAV